MQVRFATSTSEMPWGTKYLTFSEITHEFCLQFAMEPVFDPSAAHIY